MRFVSFSNGDAAAGERFGVVRGESVHPFPATVPNLHAYLALPPAGRAALTAGEALPLANVRLRAPVRPNKNVFCVGRNYMGHAEEVARARGTALNLPKVPTFFTKAPTAIVGPGDDVHLSADLSQEYDWEAELAVVIGERCRDVAEADALSVVFGYTCLNDVTARDLQRDHHQWFKGKSLDETCPIGPWIVSADEIDDPQALDIALRIDGETKQKSSTKEMIFGVRAIVASLSRGMTLEPGDVIATGTPDGVGMARTPPEFLYDGAAMEVEIAKIGVLRNSIRLSAAVPH
ncbi:MAG: fumarylacetoacetate hydrolase family protein [Candidatus Eremiobacteraeota bacterium]|nr:fumarylacetoacetate hydrolase family protein [Candidatus Eremiobacteraeota bacterium]